MSAVVPSRKLLRFWRSSFMGHCGVCHRYLTTNSAAWSGHSKWATIKHDKAKNDLRKNKGRTIIAQEIVLAVKNHGGPDPRSNPRLAATITRAKAAGMQKSAIDSSIMRGQGKSQSGGTLEDMTLEAMVPPVGLIISAETDSRARTLQDVRAIITKRGGIPSPSQFMFEQRGRIVFAGTRAPLDVDTFMEPVLDAGAIDLEANLEEPGTVIVYTDPASLTEVERLLERPDIERRESSIIWYPKEDTLVDVDDEETLKQISNICDAVSEYEGVQAVYTNIRP